MRILDFGCGSELTPRYTHFHGWPPYFSRNAASHGATVYGIDLYPPSEKDIGVYTYLQGNNVEYVSNGNLGDLPGLPQEKFHVIRAHFFTGNGCPSPDLVETLIKQGLSMKEFEPKFFNQCKSLLLPDGIMLEEQ